MMMRPRRRKKIVKLVRVYLNGNSCNSTSFKNAHSRAALIGTLNEPVRDVRRGTTLALELIRVRWKRNVARYKQSPIIGLPKLSYLPEHHDSFYSSAVDAKLIHILFASSPTSLEIFRRSMLPPRITFNDPRCCAALGCLSIPSAESARKVKTDLRASAPYSYLRAISGSMRVARRAGM